MHGSTRFGGRLRRSDLGWGSGLVVGYLSDENDVKTFRVDNTVAAQALRQLRGQAIAAATQTRDIF